MLGSVLCVAEPDKDREREMGDLRRRIEHWRQLRVVTLDERALKAIDSLIEEAKRRLHALEHGRVASALR